MSFDHGPGGHYASKQKAPLKRAPSAYNIFFTEERLKLRANASKGSQESKLQPNAMAKLIAKSWNELSDDKKKELQHRADEKRREMHEQQMQALLPQDHPLEGLQKISPLLKAGVLDDAGGKKMPYKEILNSVAKTTGIKRKRGAPGFAELAQQEQSMEERGGRTQWKEQKLFYPADVEASLKASGEALAAGQAELERVNVQELGQKRCKHQAEQGNQLQPQQSRPPLFNH